MGAPEEKTAAIPLDVLRKKLEENLAPEELAAQRAQSAKLLNALNNAPGPDPNRPPIARTADGKYDLEALKAAVNKTLTLGS